MTEREATHAPLCLCGVRRGRDPPDPLLLNPRPNLASTRFFGAPCPACNLLLLETWHGQEAAYCNVAVLLDRTTPLGRIPPALFHWLQGPVAAVWEAWHGAREEVAQGLLREAERHRNRTFGLPEEGGRLQVPDSLYARWYDALKAFEQTDAYRWPPGFERMVVPPPPPSLVQAAFVWQREGWQRFDAGAPSKAAGSR